MYICYIFKNKCEVFGQVALLFTSMFTFLYRILFSEQYHLIVAQVPLHLKKC